MRAVRFWMLCGWLSMSAGCGRSFDRDMDGWFEGPDCNDYAADINPGQPEIAGDGINNDCDPLTSDADRDQDGLLDVNDCAPDDPARPAPEVPYDGIDNDCDPATPDDDLDGDGVPLADDCDDRDARVRPGAVEIPFDGLDNDCDGTTIDADLDGDGIDSALDCDDQDPTVAGGTLWYPDCDADGFAPRAAESTLSCGPPLEPSCEVNLGRWTEREPIGEPHVPSNTTVDCQDLSAEVRPNQILSGSDGLGSAILPYDYNCDGEQVPDFPIAACYDLPNGQCGYDAGYSDFPLCGFTYEFFDVCVRTSSGCELQSAGFQAVSCL